jgi:PAS domain S-box-containing protein
LSLRNKTVIIIGVIAVAIVVVLCGIAHPVFMNSFASVERKSTEDNARRVVNALSIQIESLDTLNHDWAAWDDTYEFVQDHNQDYIDSNPTDQAMINAGLNVMAIIDSLGQIVFIKALETDTQTSVPVWQSVQNELANKVLVYHEDIEDSVTGIVLLPEGPLMLSSRPIVTSNDEGPIVGTMIMGRFLDSTIINNLSKTVHMPVIIDRLDSEQLASEFQIVRLSLSKDTPVFARPLNRHSIAGYALLADLYGDPILIARVEVTRDIYAQGISAIRYFILALLIVGIVFSILTYLLLGKLVFKRLTFLSNSVDVIGTSRDSSLRLPVAGVDEVSRLATRINNMLSALEQSQQSQRETEERYRYLFENAHDMIQSVALDGHFNFVNGAWLQTMEYTKADLENLNLFDVIHPQSLAHCQEMFARVMSGESVNNIQTIFVTKNGRLIHLEGNASARTVNGKIVATHGIFRDITERKKAEEERHRLEEKSQIAGRLAAVGEMAAGIAHEINNPLTGVLGFSKLLLEKINVPEELKDDLNVIADGSQRVADIVKRLLTFARQTKPVRTSVNMNELIDNTLKLRDYVLKTANIEVVTRFDPELPWSIVDPGQLQQVFMNLIVNAEQAMKEEHRRGTLIITTEKHGSDIRIVFQDNGPGIPKENMARLFQPFFTTKAPGEGTGLGLSLSRSIVIEHGGEMIVESEPGHGATFMIELPITEVSPLEADAVSPTIAKAEPVTIKKGRILVVDDESGVREFIVRALTRTGHSVDTASDAREALDRIDAGVVFDVIFVDIRMPGMSGLELYQHILDNIPALAGRVVFITGDVMGMDVSAFLSKHHLPHLAKPFQIEHLRETVDTIMGPGQPDKDNQNRSSK